MPRSAQEHAEELGELLRSASTQTNEIRRCVVLRLALSHTGVSLLGPGHRDDSLLAMADPYLRWLAPARHAADDFQWLPTGPDNG